MSEGKIYNRANSLHDHLRLAHYEERDEQLYNEIDRLIQAAPDPDAPGMEDDQQEHIARNAYIDGLTTAVEVIGSRYKRSQGYMFTPVRHN